MWRERLRACKEPSESGIRQFFVDTRSQKEVHYNKRNSHCHVAIEDVHWPAPEEMVSAMEEEWNEGVALLKHVNPTLKVNDNDKNHKISMLSFSCRVEKKRFNWMLDANYSARSLA
jgi:hypothetical protein